MVKIDMRSKDEIVSVIKERAKSYTPEWTMDTDSPDIATVLALAYADMYSGSLKKVNGIPLKNEIAFFNTINATLLPAAPSSGYVSFSLSSEDVGATEVPKGTVISASGGTDDTIFFETSDDLLVSPADIAGVFCAEDSDDYLGEYEEFTGENVTLFDKSSKNLQTHILRVAHPYAFDIRTAGDIRLIFFQKGGTKVNRSLMKLMADKNAVSIEYYAGEEAGYVPFSDIRESGGTILLCKDPGTPPIIADEEGFNIRLTVKKIKGLEELSFSYIEAKPVGKQIEADCVTDGNVGYEQKEFFPFGERFQLFNEVYFGCSEVLDKCGAKVTMSFDLSMIEVPIENAFGDEQINWKWVADKGDFKEVKTYYISITDVIWEYYNGFGWSRLYPDRSYSDLFNFTQGVTGCFKSISFICPKDMTKVVVGAEEGYFIRARIVKAENLYKLRGFFVSPMIRNLSFEYHYEDEGCRISSISAYNCIEEKRYDPLDSDTYDGFVPYYTVGAKNRTMYFGFTQPPDNGPFRILWDVKEDPVSKQPQLSWEYLSKDGWKHLNMIDETEGFTKVGITIFLDNHGFRLKELFGRELYWIRIIDTKDFYRANTSSRPMIRRISRNAVGAVNLDSHAEEYFTMAIYAENARFELAAKSILDFELYVNEFSTLTEAEAEKLEEQGRLIRVTGNAGMDTELWVKWEEVNTFITEDPLSRSYVIDRGEGTFTFGNGRNGRIPAVSEDSNIRVVYTTGGGKRSNVEPGRISGIERSIGFVSGVTNPKSFYGGCDIETVYEAIERSAVLLRTQGKAIAARDYERLTMCASRCVERVRCYRGINSAGAPERGAVTLVVMKKDNTEFSKVREDIRSFLLPRIAGGIVSSKLLYITEPTYVIINVRAEITAREINGIFDLKRNVEEKLRSYIDSYSGGKNDRTWKLGRVPNEQQLRSAILRIPEVIYIKNIYITTYISDPDGLVETDDEGIRKYAYVLPVSGEHDISVTLA